MDNTTKLGKVDRPLTALVPEPSTLVELARRALDRSRGLRTSAYSLTMVVGRAVQS